MAAPTFIAAGDGYTDATGAWGYTATGLGPGVIAIGDIVILQVLQDGATTGAVTYSGAAVGLKDLAGSSGLTYIGEFAHGSTHIQHLWIGRVSDTAATITFGNGANTTSEDVYCRAYLFRNVSTGTTLATVIENATAGSTTTTSGTSGTIADASVTTLGLDRLALQFIAISDDNAIASFTGETGGDWTEAVAEYAESSGTDGSIGLQTSAASSAAIDVAGNGNYASFGAIDTGVKRGQRFIPYSAQVSSVTLSLRKVGTPSDNVVVSLYTGSDDSGTLIDSDSLSGASLGTSASDVQFAVSGAISSPAGNHCIVIERSGSLDASNYYEVQYNSTEPYADGTGRYKGTVWADFSGDLRFIVARLGVVIDGGTTANADATDGWGVIGFALLPVAAAGEEADAITATASGTGLAVTTLIVAGTVGLASLSGTALDATAGASIAPVAECATASGAALNATTLVVSNAATAAASGTGYLAAASVAPNATAADATGTSYVLTVSLTALSGTADATGTSLAAAASLAVNAITAEASGTALDATVSVAVNELADAECATATGEGFDPAILIDARASPADATGTAYLGGVSTTDTAPAETADASGTGLLAAASIAPTAATSTSSGTGLAAAANPGATPAAAASSGEALALTTLIVASAETATSSGTGLDATVQTSAAVQADAGTATSSGTAADATILRPAWVSPANNTAMGSTPVLVFVIPAADVAQHFWLELDTAATFDTGDLRTYRSDLDQTGWAFWDGDTWEPVPAGGVAATYVGNEARLTVPTALDGGTWYRRVRAGG